MEKYNDEVSNYIASQPEPQTDILKELRALIHKQVPAVQEDFKWSQPVFSCEGVNFCYLKSNKKHVNLGFFQSGKITTSREHVEGSGKAMGHIKILDMEMLEQLPVVQWLHETSGVRD